MSYRKKFVIPDPVQFGHHRSGWRFAMRAIRQLCRTDGRGILLDAYVEKNFFKRLAEARRQDVVPYRRPWVGIIHTPLDMPLWHHQNRKSPRYILRLGTWRESLCLCRGLITLTTHTRLWLEKRVNVPVVSLRHPTETPKLRFSLRRFWENPTPRIVQVGRWLRRLDAIWELPAKRLRKAILLPARDDYNLRRFREDLCQDRARSGAPPLEKWAVEIIPYLQAQDYDRLLAENIVFLCLHAAAAVNTIIECIVRHTPVLVNPLPGVVEYLGQDYPFYFRTLGEASAKAEDMSLVREAHDYLRALPKETLSGNHFCRTLAHSELYRRL